MFFALIISKHKRREKKKAWRKKRKSGSKKNVNVKPGVDCLSNLHDNLLGHILSRLPVKDAVRTSALSKHWKCKWTLSNNVDTDLDTWGSPALGVGTFIDFLDEILLNHQHLRLFRTTFWCAMSDLVQDWVNAALRHNNLECLDVNTNANVLAFPASLLNSVMFRELRVVQPLVSPVTVIVAQKNCALNLTSLSLYNVAFENQKCESGIVSFEFPKLEKLELRMMSFSYQGSRNLESVEIYAPLLTSFLCEPTLFHPLFQYPPIKIFASRLKKLSCLNGLPENFVLDWSSISCVACLDALDVDGHLITGRMLRAEPLNRFTNLEELVLSCCMAEVLWNGPPLPQSDRLKRLTLLGGINANQLFKLLHEVSSLKFLSVNVDSWEDCDYEAINTPYCIASHMEEVVLQYFSGEVAQYILAEYLLKASKKLKKFTITTKLVGPSQEMKKVLSTFDRCSPTLDICSRLPDIEPTYNVIHRK